MARILDKFNRRRNPYAGVARRNPEGFPAFSRSLEEAYLQVLLTNTLTGTFYAGKRELLADSLALHAEIAAEDAAFMARAIVYARRQGFMRLQPIVGLAYLAKSDLDLFHAIFGRVINSPGDLTDFVEIVRGGVVPGGMGRSIKRAVNQWLNGLSEYHAVKYGRGGQGYSLRDVLRLTHPEPADAERDALFLWLTDRDAWLEDAGKRALLPQVDAFEQLKRVQGDQEQARDLIAAGRLPYEVATGVIGPDRETWRELMRQMPTFALLRHLNALQRAGVLRDADSAAYVADRLSDAGALRKARILPFRLFTAYRMFAPETGTERRVAEALVDGLDATFANMPDLGRGVAIAPDVSGSMRGTIGRRSQVRYVDIAGIFTAALLKASGRALVLPFEHRVLDIRLSARDSAMTITDRLAAVGGGGTAVSAPISRLLDRQIPVNTFIGITDNIEWATDQSGRRGFLPTWRAYRRHVAPAAQAFLITIAPYRHAVAPGDEPGVHYIYGWNEQVLTYISLMQGGLAGQAEAVRNLAL